eukprot:scpid79543/ scgid26848/ 
MCQTQDTMSVVCRAIACFGIALLLSTSGLVVMCAGVYWWKSRLVLVLLTGISLAFASLPFALWGCMNFKEWKGNAERLQLIRQNIETPTRSVIAFYKSTLKCQQPKKQEGEAIFLC